MKKTPKDFVLEKKPTAYITKVDVSRIKGIKDVRYYIFIPKETSYLAVEKTIAKAWKKAKEILIEREIK